MTGLVGYWPLHRTAGNAVDLSGNENHGTITGATRGVAGRGGLQAFSFDGTDDDVDMGEPTVLTASNLGDSVTLSTWVRIKDATTQGIIGKSSDTNNDNYRIYLSDVGSTGSPNANFYIDNGVNNTAQSTDLNTNAWYHICGVYDGSSLFLYVNGSQVDTISSSGSIATASGSAFAVGSRGGASQFFNGQITDAKVYDRALSAAEIQRLYEWGSGDYATPPGSSDGGVSYWTLDEDTGTTATDAWGTNDGTVTGATVGVSGVRDTAYSFDGTDDGVDLPGAILPSGSNYTLAGWGLWNTPGDADNDILIQFQSNINAILRDDGAGNLTWLHNTGSGYVTAATETIASGEWYHMAQTWDGGTVQAYLNGVGVGSVAASTVGSPASANAIGYNAATAGAYLDGRADDVRAYSRALSPAEIYQLYRYGTRGKDLRKETVNAR